MRRLVRVSTVASSLNILLKGQLRYLNDHYEVIAVSGNGVDLHKVGERERVKIYSISMERKISPINDLISLWKLYNYFRKEKPSIVHSITPKAGLLTMLAAYFARVPVRMHTFTGLIFPSKNGLMKFVLINMDKLLCLTATHVYPEGEGVKNDLISFKITNKSLRILGNGNINGINADYFSPNVFSYNDKKNMREQLSIADNDFIYLFVGRLVGDKGINELINSFKKISLESPNTKLLLVGPYEHDLDPLNPDTLSEIKSNGNIIELGFKDDIRPYLNVADVFVFPSYREGFPNVLLQAGAMNLPVIATDINGSNEIIIDGLNGIIIPVKSSNALHLKMKLIYEDATYRGQLAQNARDMIISRYKQQDVWEALLQEYKNNECYV